MKVHKVELFKSLPPEWSDDLFPVIKASVKTSGEKIIVLDDDPTGTQTVHDVPVLTEWSQDSLVRVFSEPEPVTYILTNSRSVSLSRSEEMNLEIASNLKSASQSTGREYKIVSRSDSTLRGHFPGEVIALMEGIGDEIDGILIIPFFFEGARITVEDIHYVGEGDSFVPAAETEFAKDSNFGYQHSNLRNWVGEKYEGIVNPQDVKSISISDIRLGGPEVVAAKLRALSDAQVCIVNSVSYRDMEVFVAGLLQAEKSGANFIYRTAASFVRVRGGIKPRSLLTRNDLTGKSSIHQGGLVIVGSFVQKSTFQLQALESSSGIYMLEIAVEALLDPVLRDQEIERVTAGSNDRLHRGLDVVIYTSRELVIEANQDSSLEIGQKISQALVEVVKGIKVKPGWMIAKGGITSSDIATQGLSIKRAQVLGQAIPGIPIWITGPDSRWPGMIYVVFPGNVGGISALSDMVKILNG